MSFFQGINTQETEFEMGGGDIQPIPKDTRVLAICEEAKNEEYQGNRFINLKWRVNQPAEYNNRLIFQKLRVYDIDKAEAHKKMLAAIAMNAGGRLFNAMQAANETEPSDQSLSSVTNTPMVLLLDVWELDDKSKSGNWVKSVSARQAAQQQAAPTMQAPAPQPMAQPAAQPVANNSINPDDIPF